MTGMLAMAASCSVIDDDLSDCPPDNEQQHRLDYELRLMTNISTELQTVLTTEAEQAVAQALRTHLATIFTDQAHDVDLSFYDTQGDSARLHHDTHIMDANQTSYTLNLPVHHYMHLATANIVDNAAVALRSDDRCHPARLQQVSGDTVQSHDTGLFTARLPMTVEEGISQQFDVTLYMANCAVALVVDTVGSGISDMQVFTTGFASAFSIADSAYHYAAKAPIVKTQAVETHSGHQSFCSVNFPSKGKRTRIVIEAPDEFAAPQADNSLWELHAYARAADGTTTETVLHANTPLLPGQLKVITAKAHPDATITTTDQTVAVSVTLDWHPGGHYTPDL